MRRFQEEELKMDLKGSKTEKNLQTAFAGESQAHTKYQYYARHGGRVYRKSRIQAGWRRVSERDDVV